MEWSSILGKSVVAVPQSIRSSNIFTQRGLPMQISRWQRKMASRLTTRGQDHGGYAPRGPLLPSSARMDTTGMSLLANASQKPNASEGAPGDQNS